MSLWRANLASQNWVFTLANHEHHTWYQQCLYVFCHHSLLGELQGLVGHQKQETSKLLTKYKEAVKVPIELSRWDVSIRRLYVKLGMLGYRVSQLALDATDDAPA